LQTSQGEWRDREGILLRLTTEDEQIGFGEIAPVPWFGSETLAEALEFCDRFPAEVTSDNLFTIPDRLPACQFGFESAWEMATSAVSLPTLPRSGLLPAGAAALEAWKPLWKQGYRTLKWKIGVHSISDEIDEILPQLIHTLPAITLRLDANGGLSDQEAQIWLQRCDEVNAAFLQRECKVTVEFLEQPLAPNQFDAMLELTQQYSTPIALDESVATLAQLQSCYEKGWRGIFVIKPAIAGSPTRLCQFCQNHPIDGVFSSVLETAIGQQAGLKLAGELMQNQRAVGYGVNQWFPASHPLSLSNPDSLWQYLSNC
jgi:O-succinylbenzoate synthase